MSGRAQPAQTCTVALIWVCVQMYLWDKFLDIELHVYAVLSRGNMHHFESALARGAVIDIFPIISFT